MKRSTTMRKVSIAAFTFVIVFGVNGTISYGAPNSMLEAKGGVTDILSPVILTDSRQTKDDNDKEAKAATEPKKTSNLVMANVKSALNVRKEPNEDSDKVGKLYKDCGGTIVERKDGWTKLKSGNLEGWASDEYLLFDEDAVELANDVGRLVATVNADTLRVRKEADPSAGIWGLLPRGEIVDVVDNSNEEWALIDYEGEDGYINAQYLVFDFRIDAGETLEEIKAREAAEREAKRHVNYGAYTANADQTLLLAALIQCEAGNQPYEGQVAVGAVVMNRVRSGAYPDSIHGVIYASGQFTPALNGKVNSVYESGKIKQSCIEAAKEALSGVSNVGAATHFRRNNGSREGIIIGNHVFY
ncbi:MAG: cell wall hydrolase [Lachnospiraceae bacterium]|nr:cell wall hydrolase [Lachnospiraceae bacterium]